MNKYNKKQLKSMADVYIKDKDKDGIKAIQLLTLMVMITGLNHQEVDRKIRQLSET